MVKRNKKNTRWSLLVWVSQFFLANVILLFLISLGFMFALPSVLAGQPFSSGSIGLGWLFATIALFAQSSLFAMLPGLLMLFLAMFIPANRCIQIISILFAAAIAWFLLVDSWVFYQYQFHLQGLFWHLFRLGELWQFFDLSNLEYTFAILSVGILIAIESLLAIYLAGCLQNHVKKFKAVSYALTTLSLVSLFSTYFFYFVADASKNKNVIKEAASIAPYFQSVTSLIDVKKNKFFNTKIQKKTLHYPFVPLQCDLPKRFKNIVIIVIDTWRADMMKPIITPNIAAFAKHAMIFKNHYSGGNWTEPGIFSLFYSITPNYWQLMQAHHQGPIFTQQLQEDHYQFGIFSSASLDFPAFDNTVFRDINNLQINTPGSNPLLRDRSITHEFQSFIHHRNKSKPFFSFLFYDAVHNWCGSNQPALKPFQPFIKHCDRLMLSKTTNPSPYLNRYKNAVRYDDALIGNDLEALKQAKLLKNTIVIITADHGEEFNDEHLGYWGHASRFDPYQLKTPFIVYWPGKQPAMINYFTSHYDLVPTLLSGALGCVTPFADYSDGKSLFLKTSHRFLVVSGNQQYGLILPSKIITFYLGGREAVRNISNDQILNTVVSQKVINKVNAIRYRFVR